MLLTQRSFHNRVRLAADGLFSGSIRMIGWSRAGARVRRRLLQIRYYQTPHEEPQTETKRFSGFAIQILGSAAKAPTLVSSCPSVGVHVPGASWLFDCGEGTQRQLIRSSVVSTGSLQGICITHMHGDHVLGLPGVILSGMGPNYPPVPSVYGPPGIYNFISMVLKLCEARVGLHEENAFTVHEFLEGDEQEQRPSHHRVHPSFRTDKIEYRGIPRDPDGYWTVETNERYTIRAGRIAHSIPTFGYVVREHDKRGKIDVAKVTAMGLKPCSLYRELAGGKDLTLPDGTVIRASEVMGPSKRGRKVTVLGDTSDAYGLAPLAQDSDVLIHEATLESSLERVARARGHSTPTMAANYAKHINAGHLVLNHMSNRYSRVTPAPGEDDYVEATLHHGLLVKEAEAVLGAGRVTAARDFLTLELPLPGETGLWISTPPAYGQDATVHKVPPPPTSPRTQAAEQAPAAQPAPSVAAKPAAAERLSPAPKSEGMKADVGMRVASTSASRRAVARAAERDRAVSALL